MIEYLRELEDGNDPDVTGLGLCNNLDYDFQLNIYDHTPPYVYEEWPHFSGNRRYPVKGGEFKYMNTGDYWADDNKYCELRREWCGHLADFLEEVLDNC